MSALTSSASLHTAEGARLPFFVYGTLQTGYRNHANVVRGRMAVPPRPARLPHATLVHYEAGFPGAYLVSDARCVCGQLLRVPEEVYAEVVADLDLLEDYHGPNAVGNMYERCVRAVDVQAESGEWRTENAYVYISRIDLGTVAHTPVPDGDWRAFMSRTGFTDAADDWSAKAANAAPLATPGVELDAATAELHVDTASVMDSVGSPSTTTSDMLLSPAAGF
ncbi:gamma-glutamylcyclotransferase [archaeon]|nr:MAG: gamma-glutamylcyclotransferase [archaeon]